jgi:predicted ArsR family transcriptional regulator
MKGMTIDEIAEELGIPWKTARKRIEKLGIKSLSYKAIYALSIVEAIRNVPGKGRPKKQQEAEMPQKEMLTKVLAASLRTCYQD